MNKESLLGNDYAIWGCYLVCVDLCVCERERLRPSSNICLLCNVFHNVWPLGMEKEQELADCIDSEHLKLRLYGAVQEGP